VIEVMKSMYITWLITWFIFSWITTIALLSRPKSVARLICVTILCIFGLATVFCTPRRAAHTIITSHFHHPERSDNYRGSIDRSDFKDPFMDGAIQTAICAEQQNLAVVVPIVIALSVLALFPGRTKPPHS